MATAQDIKDFFALTGNNPALTDAQLGLVQSWLSEQKGSAAGPDDLIDAMFNTVKEQAVSFKRRTQSVDFS